MELKPTFPTVNAHPGWNKEWAHPWYAMTRYVSTVDNSGNIPTNIVKEVPTLLDHLGIDTGRLFPLNQCSGKFRFRAYAAYAGSPIILEVSIWRVYSGANVANVLKPGSVTNKGLSVPVGLFENASNDVSGASGGKVVLTIAGNEITKIYPTIELSGEYVGRVGTVPTGSTEMFLGAVHEIDTKGATWMMVTVSNRGTPGVASLVLGQEL